MNIIKKLVTNWSAILCLTLCATVVCSSCGDDDDDNLPVNEGVAPDKEVPDPTGTITLSMRDANNGHTYLNGEIYIDNENFTGAGYYTVYFASLGEVKGLGNVAHIPTTGWASKVAVIPGNGYVAYTRYYQSNKGKFYRIYVKDYVISTSGGIIGAEIKYQEPFKGKDEAISLDVQSLTFPAEGGSQTLTFRNQGVIPFDVEAEGCKVEKTSTYDYSFLTNGIIVTADPNTSAESVEGTVTLTTLHGKKTVLKVTRAGVEPFISFNEGQEIELSAAEQSKTIGMSGNIAFENLTAGSSASWCKATLVDNNASVKSNSYKVKFIEDQPAEAVKAAQNNSAISYSLELQLEENTTAAPRNATITVKSKDGKTTATLKVVQANIAFEQEEIELSAASQKIFVNFTSGITLSGLKVKSSANWCKAEFDKSGNKVLIECDENSSKNSRNATITIQSATGENLAQLNVLQKVANISFVQEYVELSAASKKIQVDFTSDLAISNLKIKSSANWCKAEFNESGNKVLIECDENSSKNSRNATITIQSATGENLAQLNVLQKEATLEVNKSEFSLNRNSHYYTVIVTTAINNWEAESSADWCTFSRNGNQITFRITASTEERTAVISFKGFEAKITIHQSKYAVGDAYSENGIEGTVGYIGDDVRYIYKEMGSVTWSREEVQTGANSEDDGEYNMNVIMKIPDWEELYPAFRLCEQLNTEGVTGWYLPAKNELKLFRNQPHNNLNNLWSSTEYNTSTAYYYSVYNNNSNNISKTTTALHVIAVHKF